MAVLTAKERQFLKGIGHQTKPVVQIGKNGIDERVVNALNKALDDHELVKISIHETSDLDKEEAAQLICEATGAELVQILGRKITIYKKNKKNPKIKFQ